MNNILGLHHVTAIANNAKQNFDFYTKVLGLRLVKKTVNFDDPGTYHFYYGNETGAAGTILTFFPWEGIGKGRPGTGMATEIGYSVPDGSLDWWADRFTQFNIKHGEISSSFGESYLPFEDPDGLKINLVVSKTTDNRTAWTTTEVDTTKATKGFHSIVLTLQNVKETAKVLTEIFGYSLLEQQDNRYRYSTNAIDTAAIVDLLEMPNEPRGNNAGGTNHHVAFRVKDEATLMEYRAKIVKLGFNITEKINRDYFYSLYFREPGGVLFELATENPGFATDETVDTLGSGLRLPKQYEPMRDKIEAVLPKLN